MAILGEAGDMKKLKYTGSFVTETRRLEIKVGYRIMRLDGLENIIINSDRITKGNVL